MHLSQQKEDMISALSFTTDCIVAKFGYNSLILERVSTRCSLVVDTMQYF